MNRFYFISIFGSIAVILGMSVIAAASFAGGLSKNLSYYFSNGKDDSEFYGVREDPSNIKNFFDLASVQQICNRTGPHMRNEIVFSQDPKDLEPLLGARLVVGYGIIEDNIPNVKAITLTFESKIQKTPEENVSLSCHDMWGNTGFAMAVKSTDHIDKFYSVIIEAAPEYNMYSIRLNGNVATGIATLFDSNGEVILPDIILEGHKWGVPVCDKNGDDKMGLAEAIHYLNIAAGN